MSSYDADSEALEKICGDMDDMESERMFKKKEQPEAPKSGVSVTIELAPKVEEKKPAEPAASEDDEMKLPPFLRSKKK